MFLTRGKYGMDKRDMASKMSLIALNKLSNVWKVKIMFLRLVARFNSIMSMNVLRTISGMYKYFSDF